MRGSALSRHPIGWTFLLRRPGRRLAIVGIIVGLSVPQSAHAHVRSAIVATEYRATVAPLRSSLRAALAVRIYQSDRAIRLAVAPGHSVTVLARSGEPLLRIDSGGLAINEGSRAATDAGLSRGRTAPGPVPQWRRRSSERYVMWHDVRLRALPAAVAYARRKVPILDGADFQLEGGIRRVRAPSPWWWLICTASLGALTALVLRLRRPSALRTAQLSAGSPPSQPSFSPLTFALSPSAPVGSRLVAFDLWCSQGGNRGRAPR